MNSINLDNNSDQYTLLGIYTKKYIDKKCHGFNCDFTYTDDVFIRTYLCCRESEKLVQIELTKSEGECGSGYTAASWGHMKIVYVDDFYHNFEYVPIDPNAKFNLKTKSKYFWFSEDGDDVYYPTEGYHINFEHFTKCI